MATNLTAGGMLRAHASDLRRCVLACSLLTPLVYLPTLFSPDFLQTAWLAFWASAAVAVELAAGPYRPGPSVRLLLAGGILGVVVGLIGRPLCVDGFAWRRSLLHALALLVLTAAFAGEAERPDGRSFLQRWVLLGALAAASLAAAGGLAGWAYQGQWVGPFGNPNWAGAFAAIHAPLLLAAWAEAGGALPAAGGIACAALLAGSGSRSAWIAATLGLAAAAVAGGRVLGNRAALRRIGPALVLAVGAGILLAVAGGGVDPQAKLGLGGASTRSLEVRCRIWSATTRMALAHPLAGVGLGQFPARFPPWRSPEEHRVSGELTAVADPHNTYLARMAEGGLPGAAALALVIAGLVACARPRPAEPGAAWFAAGALGAVVAAGVAGLFSDLFPRPALLPALAALGPLALAARRPGTTSQRLRSRPVLAALALAAGLWLTWCAGVRPAIAAGHLARACSIVRSGAARSACDAAVAWAPDWPEALALRARLGDRPDPDSRSEADFAAALSVRPADPALLNDRGVLRARHGRLVEAAADFAAALSIAPACCRTWFNYGSALSDADLDRDLALEAFSRAAQAPGGHAEACYRAAALCARGGDSPSALAWLSRLRDLAPDRMERVRADRAFDSLAGNAEWAELVRK